MTTLNAKLRDNATKNEVLRSEGKIPAVFYGFNREVTSLVVNKVDFTKAFREVGETNTLTLETPSGKFDALIHEVQYDPIKDQPIHVDFLSVDMNKEVEVDVPLEFIGESAAVKAGGILVKVMYEINIVSLPSKVPHKIEVDISSLTANDSVITLKDVNFPEGVKFTEEVDAVVAAISVGKDEVEETTEAPDLSSIEVEAKGKKEVEGESTEEGK
jgi:large subunit ribosomal protein L25